MLSFFSDRNMEVEEVSLLYLEDEHMGVVDDQEDDRNSETVPTVDYGSDSVSVHTVTNPDEVVDELACIGYKRQILELANLIPPLYCSNKECGSPVHAISFKIGTALIIRWVSLD